MSAVLMPGATLGILGGGQLGRMTALAARPLGFHVHVLDPDPSCAARFVVERVVHGGFDDAAAAATLAQSCGVVTLEIEKVSLESLAAVAKYAPMRPGIDVMRVIRHRADQKAWLARHGVPLGPFRVADSAEGTAKAAAELGGRCFVKSATGGYDGRGQAHVAPGGTKGEEAWHDVGGGVVVVEAALDLRAEISVLVARRPSGEMVVYPPAFNHHVDRILAWSVIPAPIDPSWTRAATEIAQSIAEGLAIEGVLVVEMFVLADGSLRVNEMAPRPHNSFHGTEVGCVTSQFEQHVRAVCNLPLGSVEITRPTAIANLLGELWLGARPPAFDAALAIPGVRLHLYGKREARVGRKMGHLSALGTSADDAVARVQLAEAALRGVTE